MKEEKMTSKGRKIFGEVWMACPRAIHYFDFTPTRWLRCHFRHCIRLSGIALVSYRVDNQPILTTLRVRSDWSWQLNWIALYWWENDLPSHVDVGDVVVGDVNWMPKSWCVFHTIYLDHLVCYSLGLRVYKLSLTMFNEIPFQVALLVGFVVIVGGVVLLMKQRQTAKKSKRGATKAVKKAPTASPTIVRSVAKETGSVKTPGGRRSARIARKSLGHDDWERPFDLCFSSMGMFILH